MVVEQRGQPLEHDVAVQHVGVGQHPVHGATQVELQAIALIRIEPVVAAQQRIAGARHQQGTEAGIVAQAILLALPLDREHPLPASGALAVPFRPQAEQAAEAVLAGQFLVLIATRQAQLVRQRRIARYVVPQPDVLPWRRQLAFYAIAMPLRVAPVARPVGPQARPDVGGETQAQPHGARLAHLQRHRDGNALLIGLRRDGVDPYRFEVAAGLQRLVQLGDQFGVIGRVRLERRHAPQQRFVEGEVAGEAEITQAVARPADEHQLDVGHPGVRVDQQALPGKTAIEEAIARSLVLDQALGILVAPMVEHRARLQTAGAGHAKGSQVTRRALDSDIDGAQAYTLAGLDLQHQARRLTFVNMAADTSLIVAQRLGGLVGLALDDAPQTAQCLPVAPVQAADITFDIGFQSGVARGNPYVQFVRGESPRTDQQQRQAAPDMSIYTHGGGCYHGAEPQPEPSRAGQTAGVQALARTTGCGLG